MQQCSQHVYLATITAAMPHQASLEVENNVQRSVKRQCQGKTGVGVAGKASGSPRWAAELTPSHILDTHNHPLSDFEEALLVQALLSHGNKWSFIAAQYMPWRAPTDLRTACHAKPTAGLAAHNRYIQQGCSMSWLLANTTPEYRAQWEKYNNHQRAVTQAKVAAATSYGISKQASLPKAPPKGAGATRRQQRSAPVSDISSMLTGSDISAASDAGSQATHAQKESSTATVSATCADPSPIQLSDPGCDDATNVFDAAAQHAAAAPGAASAWPQPAAAATSAAAAATLPAGQLGVPEPQGILSQGLTGNMPPAVWGMGFGAPSQQGAGMLSAFAMNAGGWPAQVTSAPLGCAPMFSAPVGLGFSTGANMAYSAQCPPKQQTQHGGNTGVLQGPNPVPPAVSAPAAAAAVAADRATAGAQLQGAAVGRSRKRSADGILQGARGAAGFRSSPLQPSDTAQGVQGGYAAAGTGALTGQSPQVSAGAASAGAGTAGAGAATQAGAGATGALQAAQPEEDDPFSFLESMPSYEVPAWIEEAAEQAANAALAARGPSSTDAGAAQAPAAAQGNDNAACAGQTTKASQESNAHAQGSQHSPCVGLQAPGMASTGYKTPRSVLPTSSSCKSLASAGSREDCMRNADAAAVPAAATKRPESSMHTGSQDGDHTVLEGVLPERQSVPAAAAGLQDHGVMPHAPAAAVVAQRHSWMTDMPAQRQSAQTALQDSSQAHTSGSHGAGGFRLGDEATVAHAANAVSTLQHNMRSSRPTVLGAAKSQGGNARAASAAQPPSSMRNSTDGALAAAQAGAMLQDENSLRSSRDSALGAVQAGSVQQNNSSIRSSRDGALGGAHAQGGVQNINSMRRSRDGALGAARADNAVVQAGATLQDCSDMRSSRDSALPGAQAQDGALQAGPMLQNSSMRSSGDDALGGAQADGARAQARPVPQDSSMRSSHDAVLGIAPTQSDAALRVPAVHGGSQYHSSSCFGHAAWDGVPQHSPAPGVQEGSMMHTSSYGPDHTALDSTTAQQHADHASAQPNYGMHSGSYRAMHPQQAHMQASRHAAPTAAGLQDACNSSCMHSKAQHGQVGLLMQEERSLLHNAYGSGSFASCSGTATGGSAATAYSPNTSVTPSSADASGTVFNPKSHGPAETAGHGAEAAGMPAAAPAATMAPPAAVVPAASSALGLHPSTWGGTGVGLHRESNLSRATGGQFAPRMGAQAPKAVPAAAAGGDSCRQGSHKQTQQQKQQRGLGEQQALPGQQQLQAPTAMPAAAAHDTVRGSSDQSQQQQWVLQQQQVWPNHQQQLQPPHVMPAAAAGLDSGGSNGKPQQQQWEVEQQQACPGQQQQQQQSVPQQQQQAPQQQQQSLQQQLLKNQQRQQRTTLPQAHTQRGRRQQLPEQQRRPKQPLPQQQAGQLAPAGAAATSSQQQLEQQSLHGQQPDQTFLWPQYMPGQAWLLDMQQQQQQQDMAQFAWQQQHVQLQQHQHQHQQGLHQDSVSQQASLLQQQLQQHGGDHSDPQLGEDNTIAEDPNSFSAQLQQLLVSNFKDTVVTAVQQPKPAGQGKNSKSEGAVDAAQKQAKPKAHAAQPHGGSAAPGAPSLPGATAAEAAAAKAPRASAASPNVGAALAQYQPASAGFSCMPFGQAAAGGAVSASAPVSAAPAQYQPASAGLPSMPTGRLATATGAAVSAAPMQQQHQPASTGLPSMSAGQSAAAAVGGRTQSLPADLSKPAESATAARGFARVVGFSRAQAQARAAAAAAAAAAAGGGGLDATATSHPGRPDKGTYGMLAPSFGQQYEPQLGATAPRAPWQAAAPAPVPAAPSSAAPWHLSAMSATPTSAAADTAKAAAAAAATAAASAGAELDGGWGQMHLTADDGDMAGWGAELQHSQQPPQQQQQQQVSGVPSCLAAAATAAAKNLQLLQQQRFPRFSSMPEPGYMAAPDVYQHMPSFAAAGEAAAINSSWPQLQQYSSLPSGVGFGTAAVQTGSWHALQEQAHFAATAANGVGGAAGIHAAAEVLGQQQRRQQAHAPSPEVASTAAGDSGSSQRLPQLSSQTSAAAAAAAAAAAHDAAKTKQQQLGGSGPVAAAPVTRSAARQADGSAEAQHQQLPGASLSAAGAIAARRRTAADKQQQRQQEQEQEQQEALQPAEPAAPDALARRQAAARPMQQAEPSAAAAAAGDPAAAAAAVDPAAAAAAPVAELPVFAAAALGAGRKSRPGTNGGSKQKVQQPVRRARPAPASPATAAAAVAAARSPAMRVSSVQTQQQQQPQHKAAAAAGRSPAVAVSRVQTQQQQQHIAAGAAARSPAVGVSNVQKQQPQQQPHQHHAAGAAAVRSPAAGVSSIQKQQPQQQQTQHHHGAAGAPSAAAAAGPTGGELAAMLNGVHTAQQTVQVPYSVEDMSGVVPSTDAAALNAALDVFFGNAVDGADDEDFDLAGLFPDL